MERMRMARRGRDGKELGTKVSGFPDTGPREEANARRKEREQGARESPETEGAPSTFSRGIWYPRG